MGLRQEIAKAKSEVEVLKLLEKANKNYLSASEKTKRAWKNTAKRTITLLSKPVDTKPVDKKTSSKKTSSKKETK